MKTLKNKRSREEIRRRFNDTEKHNRLQGKGNERQRGKIDRKGEANRGFKI